MHFQYFLPDRRAVSLEDLLQRGLGYVFAPEEADAPRAMFTPRGVVNGPGGQNGVIVSSSDEQIGYYADKQTWAKEAEADYWVGYFNTNRPTPATLARGNIIPGETLLLDDGFAWEIPKARHFEEFDGEVIWRPTLPSRLTRDELGNWVPGEVKERYRRLWELATGLMNAIANEQPDYEGLDDLAMEAFACNYKVSAIELDLLGVYDETVRGRIARILVDLDGWVALSKKKLAAHVSGNSGDGQDEQKTE